ncbi:MAG: SMODS domain-containing nucleotidyltransferase [Bacteroidia bacterium]
MLDNFILEKTLLHSYNQVEINNISATSDHLRQIVNNKPEFGESKIGGSFKRGTMVKGISDVDVYFQYLGQHGPNQALDQLKQYLISSYPTSDIKRDKPSILVDFEKIPFNITPYKKDDGSSTMTIPTSDMMGWYPIDLTVLEKAIGLLKTKNPKYIDLIKILKLWNKNYDKKIKNHVIEEKVVTLFLPTNYHSQTISDWLLLFFKTNAFHNESVKMTDLKYSRLPDSQLKASWLNFIDKK